MTEDVILEALLRCRSVMKARRWLMRSMRMTQDDWFIIWPSMAAEWERAIIRWSDGT